MPKRLVLAQLHYTEPVAGTPTSPASGSTPDAAAAAAQGLQMRVANRSWVFGGADSNPISWVVEGMQLDLKQAQVGALL